MQQTNQNISDYKRVLPYFERYLERWSTSPTAQRVEQVDSMAVVSGKVPGFSGVTIPEFMLDILKEYTEVLRKDPSLLQEERPEMTQELRAFLDREKELIDEADRLNQKLKGFVLGTWDPRWKRTHKKLQNTVSQFKLTGEDYHKNMPQ